MNLSAYERELLSELPEDGSEGDLRPRDDTALAGEAFTVAIDRFLEAGYIRAKDIVPSGADEHRYLAALCGITQRGKDALRG